MKKVSYICKTFKNDCWSQHLIKPNVWPQYEGRKPGTITLKKIKKVFEKRLGYMKKVSYICIIDLRPTGDERYSVTQIEKFFEKYNNCGIVD